VTVRLSPSTLIIFAGSGLGAGGFSTEPSVIEYLLPWQSQLIVSVTVATGQSWWVQIELNALNLPASGWVITVSASGKILPLPTGISAAVAVSPLPAPLLAPPVAPPDVAAAEGSVTGPDP